MPGLYDRNISGDLLVTLTNGVTYRNFPVVAPADRNLFTSAEAWRLVSVSYTSNVAGTETGAVTAMLEKCTGSTAPGSGTDLLTATIDLKTAPNATASGTLAASAATLTFAAGDRLALDIGAVAATAVDGYFTIGYQKV